MANSIKLTRNQLKAFLPDHESVIQFEKLLAVGNQFSDATVQDLQVAIGNALAKANQANATINNNKFWDRSAGLLLPNKPGNGLKIYGESIFNDDAGANDFTVNKQTSGVSIFYDASANTLGLDAGSILLTAPANTATLSSQPTGIVDLAISTTKYVDDAAFWQRNTATLSPKTAGDSLSVDAGSLFNSDAGDNDFTIKKNTSGDALVYDAGLDKLTISGGFKADVFRYLDADTGATSCFFLGTNTTTNTGANNLAIGASALLDCTSGSSNVALGAFAAENLTTANSCIAIGFGALRSNQTALSNTAIGVNSLDALTVGSDNVSIGPNALTTATAANANIAIGSAALLSNSTGSFNTAIGRLSLYLCTGSNNLALGYKSSQNNTSGAQNTVIGTQALFSNATGGYNIAIGYQAGYSETGSNKLYIANSNTTTPLIHGDFSASELRIYGELQSTAKKETKVTSSATETLSVKDSTYIVIDTSGNTLTLSDMVDGSKMQINNSSGGNADLDFDLKLGTTTFTAPVTMPNGDSYEIVYDSGSSVWVM